MKQKIVVYPGSFDPPTNGHIDLIERASRIFDKVIILIMVNIQKSYTFTVEERVEMLNNIFKKRKFKNVSVDVYKGLLVDYLKKNKLNIVLRGLRAVSDFEYEFQMVLTNRKMFDRMETIYLMPDVRWTYLSSSLVKEIANFGGDISDFVPSEIVSTIRRKFKQ
ncbi:MAG: pantetheine-phosphate adenylyltransferase [Endomicrobia bacterium]|nr:pantetheine-phosphate adenylyltransferase [Endomicrobiia bacterium]MDW8055304.1 pantetheine-phosphate adenylyltransferase [Elusimicrobiota bacterium]